ncbi:c-type cytochrome biogenesis protein CcmI [Pseudomonas matsuisoli]|uniref:Cytochrome c-type biogenesis protein CycH n=1 Tax=Pseudomonas matsuisoli TaxID=1515666 RepID=A0A917Q1C2_9PSED|nr:c-type cytochrome biogenesis protein CcmI [Pseudomonas matsuisoli]GGK05360.1 cytochrome c-type biogenesis protein CycH [Pseudomonas matsuisoli]
MIEFWISAGLLCLIAMGFLLLPSLRRNRARAEEDRTAVNVALYEERVQALEEQHQAGVLDEPGLQTAQDEAARELLADTDGDAGRQRVRGRVVPMLAAVCVPVLGLLLYAKFGAIGAVEQARTAAEAPGTIEQITARLERAVRERPESSQGWYFLGRTLIAEGRAADAAKAFQRAAETGGRAPAVLGLWAQALYFAGDKQWSPQLDALTDEALAADPSEASTLGLLGIHAFDERRYADAIGFWEKLLAIMPAGEPSRQGIERSIAMAKAQMDQRSNAQDAPTPAKGIRLRVALADALQQQVRPNDAVFVFARAVDGPPMPLAVKRLRVADLPAEVSLSDTDAMMPELTLSAFEKVELVARISRAGDAQHGEWIGREQGAPRAEQALREVVIDALDKGASGNER